MTSDESLDEGVKAQWCANIKEFHELAKPTFKKKHEDIDKYYRNLCGAGEDEDGSPGEESSSSGREGGGSMKARDGKCGKIC